MDSKPLFDAYYSQMTFIEIVRHPLYMIKQQALNMKRLFNMPRDFVTYYQYENTHVPLLMDMKKSFYKAMNLIEPCIVC